MFYRLIFLVHIFIFSFCLDCTASVKQCEFAGQFYPSSKAQLSGMINEFLDKANPGSIQGNILVLISPHAGYGYSGQTAAYGYKLIRGKPYKTVVVLGTSHHRPFSGAAIMPEGSFQTILGRVDVDEEFAAKLIDRSSSIFPDDSAFVGEHSLEVQIPFLQEVLSGFKIVPLVVGDCSLPNCENIASILQEAIGTRKDVLLVVSSDLYHGYSIKDAQEADSLTLGLIKDMDYQGLYYAMRESRAQACGGFGAVIALDAAKKLGYDKAAVLARTNSAQATGETLDGRWTVGYASVVVYNPQGGEMLNIKQRKKLLEIARASIDTFLRSGKKIELSEDDPLLKQEMGAFVTLNERGQLRGCIGNLSATQPLYLTIRDMAVEAAVDDPRFPALTLPELKETQIEISVLSPLKRVDSADKIELGKHGVLVRRGYHSGVFLPQVADETGWGKEEFLDNLCAHKAGLPADAWKNKDTELYIFEAEVFSEGEGAEK
jgi:AmmeMemoRadiSam system protein B/AmmeMemoRadiSam system protein A